MDRKSVLVGVLIGAVVVAYVVPAVKARRAASGRK